MVSRQFILSAFMAGIMSYSTAQTPLNISSRVGVAPKPMTLEEGVLIDPGHDGYWKPGKLYGVAEHETTLTISNLTKQLLEEKNIPVLLTREDSQPLAKPRWGGKTERNRARTKDLKLRSDMASVRNAKTMISIHSNYGEKKIYVNGRPKWIIDPEKNGMEVFFFGYNNKKYIGNRQPDYFNLKDTPYGSKPSKQRAIHFAFFLEQETGEDVKVMGADFTILNYRGNWKELQRERILWEIGYETNYQERNTIRNNPEYYADLLARYIETHVPKMRAIELKRVISNGLYYSGIGETQTLTPELYRLYRNSKNRKVPVVEGNFYNPQQFVLSSSLEKIYVQPIKTVEKKKGFFKKLFGRN